MRPHGQESIDSGFERIQLSELSGLPPQHIHELTEGTLPQAQQQEDSIEIRIDEGDTAVSPLSFSLRTPELILLKHKLNNPTLEVGTLDAKTTEIGNELPVLKHEAEIVDAIINNQVVIIVGEPGSGKSTMVPLMLHKAGINHVHLTQPRRPAAYNVGQRLLMNASDEYGPENAEGLVRIQTAVFKQGPIQAPMHTVTEGIELPRELTASAKVRNRDLPIRATLDPKQLDVTIVDESHLQSLNTEFTSAAAIETIKHNPNKRLVYMSATMDTEYVKSRFAEITGYEPPVIHVEGRQFPIEMHEAPDSSSAEVTVLNAIDLFTKGQTTPEKLNAIIVFAKGKQEIDDRIDDIFKLLPDELKSVVRVSQVHSMLSVEQQNQAVAPMDGIRIIVGTNILQESVTVQGVARVVDDGEQNVEDIDAHDNWALVHSNISQAEIYQRAGRCGRMGPGIYTLAPSTKGKYLQPIADREKFPFAAIRSSDATRFFLRAISAGFDPYKFNDSLINRLETSAVDRIVNRLRVLGAIAVEDTTVTTIGKRMNVFPADIAESRIMVEADRFSNDTRRRVAAIVACMEVRGLQYFAKGAGQEWRSLTEETQSDLLAQLDLFIYAQEATAQSLDKDNPKLRARLLREKGLSINNVDRAMEKFERLCYLTGIESELILRPQSDQEKQDIITAITSGQFPYTFKFAHRTDGVAYYRRLHGGAQDTLYQISNRSVIRQSRPQLVVGNPMRVIKITKEGSNEIHIIESGTIVQAADIGRAASHLVQKEFDSYVPRDGRFVERVKHKVFGMEFGVEERVADPTPKLRETIIQHVLEHPGPNQQELRRTKKILEKLDHMSKTPIRKITENHLRAIIEKATPEDVDVAYIVDRNLGELVREKGYTVDGMLNSGQKERIIQNAPVKFTSEGVEFAVAYENHQAIIRKYNPDDIAKLTQEIFLPDGRQVKFMYFYHTTVKKRSKRECTLIELQEKLREDGSIT